MQVMSLTSDDSHDKQESDVYLSPSVETKPELEGDVSPGIAATLVTATCVQINGI